MDFFSYKNGSSLRTSFRLLFPSSGKLNFWVELSPFGSLMELCEDISEVKEILHGFSVDYFRSILPLRSLKEVRVLEKVAEGS